MFMYLHTSWSDLMCRSPSRPTGGGSCEIKGTTVQGYLAYKKTHPVRTLP